MKDLSPSTKTAIKVLYNALQALKNNENELPSRNVMEWIEKNVELSEWEKERYEKTGYVRWQSILHFYTIGAIKAGYLRKQKGVWYLTEDGLKAASRTPEELFQEIKDAYKKWDSERAEVVEKVGVTEENVETNQEVQLQQLEEQAISSILDFVRLMNPYVFQDLVAALLRGMGYYTPFVAPKGKDGGIDIVAYKDPLGIEKPIIKVQVKHHPDSPIQSQDVQKLKGVLSHDEEVGILVTSGRFSIGAIREARTSKSHIEIVDITRFIELWKSFYHKLSDEDKNLLPLKTIHFLGTNE